MEKKDFYVGISFSGRLNITVSAEDKEEAVNKIYNALGGMDIKSSDEDVYVDEIEWDLFDGQNGNIAVPFVENIDVQVDDE